MKKHSIFEKDSKAKAKRTNKEIPEQELVSKIEELKKQQGGAWPKLTIGVDLGDRMSFYCVLDETGEVIGRGVTETSGRNWSGYSGGYQRVGSP